MLRAGPGSIDGLVRGREYLVFVGSFNADLEYQLSELREGNGRVTDAILKDKRSGLCQWTSAGGRSRTEQKADLKGDYSK